MNYTAEDLEIFVDAYIEAMFFTDSGDSEDELNGKTIEDFAPQTMDQIIKDCKWFLNRAWPLIEDTIDDWLTQAGYDYWFNRCRHGCGFWDGDWDSLGQERVDQLVNLCHQAGEVWPYVGDDGLVYHETYKNLEETA